MAELDVSHFRTVSEPLKADVDLNSVEAPARPKALQDNIVVEQVQSIEPTEIVGPNDIVVAPKMLPPALRRIDFENVQSREELFQGLNATIPLNEFNLPKYTYRVDLVDYRLLLLRWRQTDVDGLQDHLTNAIVHLDYSQGFPTFMSGLPFWSKADYESKEAYDAFLQYLEQPGARTFDAIPNIAAELLRGYYHLYMWAHRARAYDMFQAAHHQRLRLSRIMKTEDSHYLQAEKMVSKIAQALNGKTAEDLAAVDADKLVSMFEKLTRVQRIAIGLPANGGIDDSKAPANTSVEVTMRTIAKKSGQDAIHDDTDDMEMMLADVDVLTLAQEFVVKVNK